MKKHRNVENNIILSCSAPFQASDKSSWSFVWSELDWNYILHTASMNNVEYRLCKNLLEIEQNNISANIIHRLRRVKQRCDFEISKYISTLKYLENVFKSLGIPFLFFKCVAPYSFVKDDIDVFIRNQTNFKKTYDALVNNGYEGSYKNNLALHLNKKDKLQIDLHPHISWDMFGRSGNGFNLLNEDMIWNRKKLVNILGVSVYVPSVEDDILILCAHSIFQHHYITLNEVFHIGELIRTSQKLDWNYILTSTNRLGWNHILCFTLYLIHKRYAQLYQESVIPKPILEYIKKDIKKVGYDRISLEDTRIDDVTYIHSISLTGKVLIQKMYSDYKRRKKEIFKLFFAYTINLLITVYRYGRYSFTKRLPFNLDWLEKL